MITYIGMLDRWFDHVDASPLVRLLGQEKPPDDNPAAGDENEEDGRRPEGRSLLVVQSHRVACSFRSAREQEKYAGLSRGHPQLQKHSCDDRRHC